MATCVASLTFATGKGPWGLAFDGNKDVWITNQTDDTVTELSPSGTTIGTYPVGKLPLGIAYDGTNMWVVNQTDNTVTELSPNGTTLNT
jgi:DNA-binding beta-propeller fold protein YncE